MEPSVIYSGLLIKESVGDEAILDCLDIRKVELWKTPHTPRYWTALTFTSRVSDLPLRLSRVLVPGGGWYVDLKAGNHKYIVLPDRVLEYAIGDQAAKNAVCDTLRKLGFPESQLDWAD